MASKEHAIICDLIKNAGREKRLFRANCGLSWTGTTVDRGVNWVKILNPRPIHGLPTGFSDIFGLQTIEITQEMVGQKVAVFTAIEVKTGHVPLTAEQKLFGEMVLGMGGQWEMVRR